MNPLKSASVTIRQVAEAAGVHFSTVSRALNPATRQLVKPQLAKKVQEAAHRLGYHANAAASSLRTGRSKVVGVIVPDLGSMLFPLILEGIDAEFQKSGYMTIIGHTANDDQQQRRILAGLSERQVDGLIIATATLDEPVTGSLLNCRVPVVLINRTDRTGRTPAVLHDDLKGIHLAFEHLVALGHTNIAHLAGPSVLSTGSVRLRGFRLAHQEMLAGAKLGPVVEAKSFSVEAGKVACLSLLKRNKRVTAIVAANDLLAIGCYEALSELGLKCPDEISVTGYNNTAFSGLVRPALTTVNLRLRDMGIEAARMLAGLMSGNAGNADVVLRPSLVVRGSTAPAPTR
jgi:LacI family transcriptional regulator